MLRFVSVTQNMCSKEMLQREKLRGKAGKESIFRQFSFDLAESGTEKGKERGREIEKELMLKPLIKMNVPIRRAVNSNFPVY